MATDNDRREPMLTPSPPPRLMQLRGFAAGHPALQATGIVLLILFGVALGVSLTREPLPRAAFGQTHYDHRRITHIPVQPFIGLDFHHNYRAVKTWHGGGAPYAEITADPANRHFVYPPLTLLAFTWAEPFPSGELFSMERSDRTLVIFGVSTPAILIWLGVSLAIIAWAAWRSWQVRASLGLPAIPLPLILGGTLVSYPVLFELERGNCNVWPLAAATLLTGHLRSESRHRHWVMGLCVAVAVGIKPYAIVLLPALIALHQFRALAWSFAWLCLQGLLLAGEFQAWLGVAALHNQTETKEFMDWSHSLISHWNLAWTQVGATRVAAWPAQVTVSAFLFIACSVVAWPVLRSRDPVRVAWPFLLWVLAVGTMLLPIAYDYNLLFVPLLLASAWQARDPWWIHALVGLALLWLQPFYFGVIGLPLLAFKVASVLSLGALVVVRTREPGDRPIATSGLSPLTPRP